MNNKRINYDSEFITAEPGFIPKAGSGFLRLVLLFGSAVVALSLVIIPILTERSNQQTAQSLFPEGVDRMVTGSVKKPTPEAMGLKKTSTEAPASCITADNDTLIGDC